MKYHGNITNNADLFGYKAANLIFLSEELNKYNNNNIKFAIPEFNSISHQINIEHLDQFAPTWRQTWEKFVTTYKEQADQAIISPAATKILEELQLQIKQCFSENLLPIALLTKTIPANSLLMVRSTGKEDSTEFANPGGNESKACIPFDNKYISQAMGEVIASYFSLKSLSQRIKSGDDITNNPFLPVLIQKMIGDEVYKSSTDNQVYSGVIYTNNGCSTIQAAPGHGELVVDSKGIVDNYYVTEQNMVYADTGIKEYRLAPGNEGNLIPYKNSSTAQYSPSLNEATVVELHKLAIYIERLYQMRMDIEFVFDAKNNSIYIVQARPIVLRLGKTLSPSAIAIEHMERIVTDNDEVVAIGSATIAINCAVVIDEKAKVIIAPTIEQALASYYRDNGKVLAIIVNQIVFSTSHAAGELASKNIPLLFTANHAHYEKMVQMFTKLNKNNVVVIDSQRKKVLMLKPNIINNIPFSDNIENDLYQIGILKKGIFSSTLSGHTSPYQYDIDFTNTTQQADIEAPVVLGGLLQKAKLGDNTAISQLGNFLFSVLDYQQDDNKINSYKELTDNLDHLANVKYSASNEDGKRKLSLITHLVAKLFKKGLITHTVFTQIILTAGELYLELEKLTKLEYTEDSFVKYLNILAKFNGLITAIPIKNSVTESVVSDLTTVKYNLELAKEFKIENLSQDQRFYFLQVTKLGNSLIDQAYREHWNNFCWELCQNLEQAQQLAAMVLLLTQKDIYPTWINTCFLPTFLENNKDTQQTFIMLKEEIMFLKKKLVQFAQADYILNSLEAQIPLWADPKNFASCRDILFEDGKTFLKMMKLDDLDLLSSTQILKYRARFVDILDRAIKSLQRSEFYIENDVQLHVPRVIILVKLFFSVLKNWSKNLKYIDPNFDNKLSILKRFIDDYKPTNPAVDFDASANFAVNAAILGSKVAVERSNLNNNHHLEDAFSLVHQNLEVVIATLLQPINEQAMPYFPKLLQEINSLIANANLNVSAIAASANSPLSLIGLDIKQTAVTLKYNIPLRNHAGSVTVVYNYKKRDIEINISMFGHNESNRFSIAGEILYTHALHHGIKVLQQPEYNPINRSLNYKLRLTTENQIKILIENLVMLMQGSFLHDEISIDGIARRLSELSIENVINLCTRIENISLKTNIPLSVSPRALLLILYKIIYQDKDIEITAAVLTNLFTTWRRGNKPVIFANYERYRIAPRELLELFPKNIYLNLLCNKQVDESIKVYGLNFFSNYFSTIKIELMDNTKQRFFLTDEMITKFNQHPNVVELLSKLEMGCIKILCSQTIASKLAEENLTLENYLESIAKINDPLLIKKKILCDFFGNIFDQENLQFLTEATHNKLLNEELIAKYNSETRILQFDDLSTDTINNIVFSNSAVQLYKSGYLSFHDIIEITKKIGDDAKSNQFFIALSNINAASYHDSLKAKLDKFIPIIKASKVDVIKVLISDNAFILHKEQLLTPADLLTYTTMITRGNKIARMEYLLSFICSNLQYIKECLDEKLIDFNGLIKITNCSFESQILSALNIFTSIDATNLYESGIKKFEQLIDEIFASADGLNKAQILFANSLEDYLGELRIADYNKLFSYLYTQPLDIIKLTFGNEKFLKFVNEHSELEFDKILQISHDKLVILLDNIIISACLYNNFVFADLEALSLNQLKLLNRFIIGNGLVLQQSDIIDLKKINPSVIDLLIEKPELLAMCGRNCITLELLSKFNGVDSLSIETILRGNNLCPLFKTLSVTTILQIPQFVQSIIEGINKQQFTSTQNVKTLSNYAEHCLLEVFSQIKPNQVENILHNGKLYQQTALSLLTKQEAINKYSTIIMKENKRKGLITTLLNALTKQEPELDAGYSLS